MTLSSPKGVDWSEKDSYKQGHKDLHQGKMIYIYLDTNFLSQLSKTASDTKQEAAGTDNWGVLPNMLRQGVNTASLICPAPQFQTQEAILAEGLQREFISLQHELCRGQYFTELQEILVHQTAEALLCYLG